MIDHLVYAASNLPRASASIAELIGQAPEPGGQHLGRGTYNELLALGGTTYLEVIGPDPAQADHDGPRPFGVDTVTSPALVAWCVRPPAPLTAVVPVAAAVGIEFGEISAMSRRRQDGLVLEWELTVPQTGGPFGCALPFLIDWGTSSHPTDTLAPAAQLAGLVITCPAPDELRSALEIVGVGAGVEVAAGPPSLTARIETRRGTVTLTS